MKHESFLGSPFGKVHFSLLKPSKKTETLTFCHRLIYVSIRLSWHPDSHHFMQTFFCADDTFLFLLNFSVLPFVLVPQDAISTLNTLQVYAAALKKLRHLQLKTMRGFLERAGLTVSQSKQQWYQRLHTVKVIITFSLNCTTCLCLSAYQRWMNLTVSISFMWPEQRARWADI